jgi:hypothetical protein
MNLNYPVSLGRAFMLGLVNGLVGGGVAYTLLWLSVEYENSRPSKSGLNIHVSVGIKWWVPSFIGGVAVSIASVLIHRFLASRVKSVLLLWQYVAVTSVLCGYVFLIILEIANDRLGGYPPFELDRWISASAGRAVLTTLAFVAPFNLLYGAFIKLMLARYSRKRSFELP